VFVKKQAAGLQLSVGGSQRLKTKRHHGGKAYANMHSQLHNLVVMLTCRQK